jgi:hypothetical protein
MAKRFQNGFKTFLIPANSSSEGEDQNSLIAKAPTMPPKLIKKKDDKNEATIFQVIKLSALETTKVSLQAKSN